MLRVTIPTACGAVRCSALPLVLAAVLAAESRADCLLPGYRQVKLRVELDLGAFAASAPREHTVVAGETLARIAREKLGRASRWHEIVALNPGIEPTRLKIRQRLVIPPPPGKDGKAVAIRYHFFALRVHPSRYAWGEEQAAQSIAEARRLFHGPRPWIMGGGSFVVAVPHENLEAWQREVGARLDPTKLKKLQKEGVIAFGQVKGGESIVHRSDPTQLIEVTLRVEKIEGNRVEISRQALKFDADAKRVATAAGRRNLLFTSGAGLLGLVGVAMRRRRRE